MQDQSWRRHYEVNPKTFGLTPEACGYQNARSFHVRQQAILRWVGNVQGSDILDVGCGPGLFSGPLIENNQVVGVDFSRSMLALAQSQGIAPIASDARKLPFRDGTFQHVLCIEMVQNLNDCQSLVAELVRVKRPEGTVYLSTSNSESIVRRISRTYYRMRGDGSSRLSLYSIPDLIRAFNKTGVDEVELMTLYYPFQSYRIKDVSKITLLDRLLATSFVVKAA